MKPMNQKKGNMMKLSVRGLIMMTTIMVYMGLPTSARGTESVVEATCHQTLEGIKNNIGKVLMTFLSNPKQIHPVRILELLEQLLHRYLCVRNDASIAQLKAAIPGLISVGRENTKQMLEALTAHMDSTACVVPDYVTAHCNSLTLKQKIKLLRQTTEAFKMTNDKSLAEVERIVLS